MGEPDARIMGDSIGDIAPGLSGEGDSGDGDSGDGLPSPDDASSRSMLMGWLATAPSRGVGTAPSTAEHSHCTENTLLVTAVSSSGVETTGDAGVLSVRARGDEIAAD